MLQQILFLERTISFKFLFPTIAINHLNVQNELPGFSIPQHSSWIIVVFWLLSSFCDNLVSIFSIFTKNSCKMPMIRVSYFMDGFSYIWFLLNICFSYMVFSAQNTIVPPKASTGILHSKNKRLSGSFESREFLFSWAYARLKSSFPSISLSWNCS